MERGIWRDAARSGPKTQGAGEGEWEAQEVGGGSDSGQWDSQGGDSGELLSSSWRHKAVRWVCVKAFGSANDGRAGC
jgi:hypothetical protein